MFLIEDDYDTIIKLPIMPSEFEISSPFGNETFETMNQGEIIIPGRRGLRSVQVDSFFPGKEYSFNRANDYKGWEYVQLFEEWRDNKLPIRWYITNANKYSRNMLIFISEFNHGLQDGTGDVYYSMNLIEAPKPKLGKMKR